MDLLLCWSKERSQKVASVFYEWLPKVLPSLKPWMSERDIEKGVDWFDDLSGFLSEAKAVLVCMTPENVRSPWIYYECGRVAGRSKTALICPYLLEDEPSILSDGPLGKLQYTKAEKEDTFRLVKSFNRALEDRSVDEHHLGSSFETVWPELWGSLVRIRQIEVAAGGMSDIVRTDVDVLAGGELSSDARTLLLGMGRDQHGQLYCSTTSWGHHFQCNGKELNEERTARSTARWRAARQRLLRLGLVEMRGSKGEVFEITAKGFEVFDMLGGVALLE